jgi:hypothetical protein
MDVLSQLRDIEDILRAPWVRLIEGILWGLGAILGLTLLVLLLRRLQRYLGSGKTLTPCEKALQRLAALRATDNLATGDWQGFYFSLYPIFKHFAAERHGLDITQMTNEELQADLTIFDKVLPTPQDRDFLAEFLRRSETIKFAKSESTLNEALADLTWCEAWVRKSAKRGSGGKK